MESLCIYGLVIANGIDQRSVHHRYPWHTTWKAACILRASPTIHGWSMVDVEGAHLCG